MNAIQLLRQKFHKLTVDEAVWLAQIYSCDREELLFNNPPAEATKRLSLAELGERPWEVISFAKDIEVSFWGGPPGDENYYFGSVQTFIIDRILKAQVKHEIGFGWLLTFDDGSARSMEMQLGSFIPDSLTQRRFWEDAPFDGNIYEQHDNPIVEYAKVGAGIIPIYENGGQGVGVPTAVKGRMDVSV